MNLPEIFDKCFYDGLVAELGPDDVAEVLGTFLADTEAKLDRLFTGDLDVVATRREAHAIKSSAATFGFVELSRLAREIEKGSSVMDPEGLSAALWELRHSFARVRRLAEGLLQMDIRENVG